MDKNPLKLIADNYKELNRMMVKEVELASAHPGLTGSYREEMWRKFFRNIVPLKFSFVHGAMIIDSKKNISNEVDIAVIDEQYTPYIFQYHTLKFVPIEAVSMVIECKSTSLPKEQLEKWAESIKKLEPKNTGLARMINGYATGVTNQTQSQTHPIKVLVSLYKTSTLDSNTASIEELGQYFDIIIQEFDNKKEKEFKVTIPNEDKSLGWWGDRLNHKNYDSTSDLKLSTGGKDFSQEHIDKLNAAGLNVSTNENERILTNKLSDLKIKDNPLLSLNLQLNQLLMLINNPMLFPHFAYAKAFQDIVKESEEKACELQNK